MPGAGPAARPAIASTPQQPIRPTRRRAPGSAFGHSSVAPCALSVAGVANLFRGAALLRAARISLRERLNLPRGPAPHEIKRLLIGAGECEILDLTRRGNGAQVLSLRAIDLDAIAPGVIHATFLVHSHTVGAAGEFVAKPGPDVASSRGGVDLRVPGEVAAVCGRPLGVGGIRPGVFAPGVVLVEGLLFLAHPYAASARDVFGNDFRALPIGKDVPHVRLLRLCEIHPALLVDDDV